MKKISKIILYIFVIAVLAGGIISEMIENLPSSHYMPEGKNEIDIENENKYHKLLQSVYDDNKDYFDTVSEAFSEKYEGFASFSKNSTVIGTYYLEDDILSFRLDYDNENIYHQSKLNPIPYFDFSDEETKALKYILKNLEFKRIEIHMRNENEFQITFIRYETSYVASTKDFSYNNIVYYGISYATNSYHENSMDNVLEQEKTGAWEFYDYYISYS